MSTIPFALSSSASSGISTIFRDLLPQSIRNFLPVARNRGRIIETSKTIGNESVEEMLFAISTALAPNLSNDIGERQIQNLPLKIPCPFGDWPAELWPSSVEYGSSSYVEN